MTILKLLSLLLILAGKAEQSVSALAPLSEPVLGRDQSGLPPPAQLTPDELVSKFLEKKVMSFQIVISNFSMTLTTK